MEINKEIVLEKDVIKAVLNHSYGAITKQYNIVQFFDAICGVGNWALSNTRYRGQNTLQPHIVEWNKANPDKLPAATFERHGDCVNGYSLYFLFNGMVFDKQLPIANIKVKPEYQPHFTKFNVLESIDAHVFELTGRHPSLQEQYRIDNKIFACKKGTTVTEIKDEAEEPISATVPTVEEIAITEFNADKFPVYSINDLKVPFIAVLKGAKLPFAGFRSKVLKSTMAQIYRQLDKQHLPYKQFTFYTFYGEHDDADETDVAHTSSEPNTTSVCFFHDYDVLKMAAYTLLNQMSVYGASAKLIFKLAEKFEELKFTTISSYEPKKKKGKDSHNLVLEKPPVIETQTATV